MRSFRLLIALIVSGTMAVPIPAAAAPKSYMPGEILVKFKPGTPPEKVEQILARLKTTVKRKPNFIGVQMHALPTGLSVEEAVALYRQDPDILYAEPNYIRRASAALPDDPKLGEQWGLHNAGQVVGTTPPFRGRADADIDAPEAWEITTGSTGSSSIIIAVIDSGVDYTHPDLSANIWANAGDPWTNPQDPSTGNGLDDDGNAYPDDFHGWNFVGTQTCTVDANNNCNCTPDDPVGTNDPMDDNGHGTHVSGIIAARGDNGAGIAGVLWNAQIMPLKILDANGCGSTGDEIQAIDYAIQKGARIINASFGGPDLSSSEEDAIRAASDAGIVVVAAAGNESSNNDNLAIYPASFDISNVISVAASDSNDQLSFFSNFGKNQVDLAAPGTCIYSTTPVGSFALQGEISCNNTPITPNYAYISGTSMAAPHVSGVAGLLFSQDPSLTPEAIRTIILTTADPREGLKGRMVSSGRLNASSALRRIRGTGLIGGDGGCGFPLAMIGTDRREAMPTSRVLYFFLGLFWPLLIPLIRKHIRRRKPSRVFLNRRIGASASAILILSVLWPSTAAALEEDPSFQPVHSLGLKIGHHRYDQSDYLDSNSGLISRGDLAGLSKELEYDWQWRKEDSLSVTAGRYHSRTDLKNICCDSLEFSTTYLLFTPKHYWSTNWVEWYIGGGIGYYDFRREIHGFLKDHLAAHLLGIHAVAGLSWPVLSPISIFTEARYALAKVKSADDFDDALDVGGLNYMAGVRWRFLPAGFH